MTEQSWPFDGTDTTEAQFSLFARRFQYNGVWGAPDTSDLKVFGDGSGMNVKVPAGYANVQGFQYLNDAVKTLTIGAAGSSPRVDSVVLNLDLTANSITAQVVQGTAAASPVAPTLTQTDTGNYQLEIAQVAVAASATVIQPANVTDTRRFMGNVPGLWSTANRPTSPRVGVTLGWNYTLKRWEYYDGTTWVQLAGSQNYTLPTSVVMERGDITNGATDWNQLLDDGVYRVAVAAGVFSAGSNTPGIATSGTLSDNTPYSYGVLLVARSGTGVAQTYISTQNKMYFRSKTGASDWTQWNEVALYTATSGGTGSADVTSTSAFVAASGWSVLRQKIVKRNGIVSLDLSITRTGGNVSVGSDGNVSGSLVVGTLGGTGSTYKPFNDYAAGSPSQDGDAWFLSVRKSDNAVILTSGIPNNTLATGEQANNTFTYITV